MADNHFFSEYQTCPHSDVDANGSCISCGEIKKNFIVSDGRVNYNYLRTAAPDKNVLKEFERYGINGIEAGRACEIYNQMNKSSRQKNRRQLLFVCAYNANNELFKEGIIEERRPTEELAKLFRLKNGEINKAFTKFSPMQTGYDQPNDFKTCIDYIPSYCRQLGFQDYIILDIVKLGESVLTKEPELNEHYPKRVCAGVILYFIEINSIPYDKEKFTKVMELSEMTVRQMYNQVGSIDNK